MTEPSSKVAKGEEAVLEIAEMLFLRVSENTQLASLFDQKHSDQALEEFANLIEKLSELDSAPIAISPSLLSQQAVDSVSEILLHSLQENSAVPDPLATSLAKLTQSARSEPRLSRLVSDIKNAQAAHMTALDAAAGGEDAEVDGLNGDFNIMSFEELDMPEHEAKQVQEVWSRFNSFYDSSEAAGEAMFDAILDASPTLGTFFKLPRAVASMRLQEGINQIIKSLRNPKQTKQLVDVLGFKHLNLEVTGSRVRIIRDALVELVASEVIASHSRQALGSFIKVLNYIGGALLYIRATYSQRLQILSTSWAEANRDRDKVKKASGEKKPQDTAQLTKQKMDEHVPEEVVYIGEERMAERRRRQEQHVPKTFYDMFCFNAAVMDLLQDWMFEILDAFDDIVCNAANVYRLQEESDVLVLKISKLDTEINLDDFKAVMLASLRSLLPKDWTSAHEEVWCWLWESVQSLLNEELGKPAARARILSRYMSSLDDQARQEIGEEVYRNFFTIVPAGQDYMKQSRTRLHFIADSVMRLSEELYQEPYQMVEELSALGLRHVGYAVPTEFFGPFVNAFIEVVKDRVDDPPIIESFSWSLGLMARMLVRTIKEGSTIVMKAINQNSKELLGSALICAPRGERFNWVLTVAVGTQSISPLEWAVTSGNWVAAELIIQDLLTIRADRERYYYGLDALFERHPDIIQLLCTQAQCLLKTLLDGMMWHSHLTSDGMRRTNYYIKHLITDRNGDFAPCMKAIVQLQDPGIAVHRVLTRVTGIVWQGLIRSRFIFGTTWLLFNFMLFVLSHGLLNHEAAQVEMSSRIAMFTFRSIIYFLGMTQLIYGRVRHICRAIKDGDLVTIANMPIPKRMVDNWREPVSCLLASALIIMFFIEPVLSCLQHYEGDFEGSGLFTDLCPEGKGVREVYSILSLFIVALYMALLLDLAALSIKLNAYVLVAINVLPELFLMITAVAFLVIMFATCVAVSHTSVDAFKDMPTAGMRFFQIAAKMQDNRGMPEISTVPLLMVAIGLFVLAVVFGAFNIFVAQLTCAHQEIYDSMVGYSILRRMQISIDTMQTLRRRKFKQFVDSLVMDEPLEFGEGDIGLPGGVQIMECASLHPQNKESIIRFGGSTESSMQWPKEEALEIASEDARLDRLVKKFDKSLLRISKMMKKRGFSSYTSAVTSRMGASTTKTSTKLSSAPDGEPTSGASGAASYTSEEPNSHSECEIPGQSK
ncbi:unnamed protein product [Symbiodinium sp. CCMP2456]|nr:unnamed protein product [Symbiodinium sp. CCMP2456]